MQGRGLLLQKKLLQASANLCPASRDICGRRACNFLYPVNFSGARLPGTSAASAIVGTIELSVVPLGKIASRLEAHAAAIAQTTTKTPTPIELREQCSSVFEGEAPIVRENAYKGKKSKTASQGTHPANEVSVVVDTGIRQVWFRKNRNDVGITVVTRSDAEYPARLFPRIRSARIRFGVLSGPCEGGPP